MKNMICFFLAAVLIVVMMAPMEARASVEEGSNIDPEIVDIIENSDDPVSEIKAYASSVPNSGQLIEPRIGGGYNPFSFIQSDCFVSEGDSGLTELHGLIRSRASIGPDVYFDTLAPGYYSFTGILNYDLYVTVSITLNYDDDAAVFAVNTLQSEIACVDYGGFVVYIIPQTSSEITCISGETVTRSIHFYMIIQGTGEPVYIDPTLRAFTYPAYVYCNQSFTSFLGNPESFTDRTHNNVRISNRTSSFEFNGLYCESVNYGGTVSAIEGIGGSIISSISELGDRIGNWFQTQWTFGRQWTDDIIDAVVGQSGGGGISSAQDELDNQLNSIEVVEQQLSDQVADKIEVPSVSLNADETGGLRWVITTINSLYLSFNELHVMFACVVFFGIIAVLLFGRRNL